MCQEISGDSCKIVRHTDAEKAEMPPASEFKPSEIRDLLESENTFVINLTAAWCHDCADQKEVLKGFIEELEARCLIVIEMQVQGHLVEGEKVFYSPEYQAITDLLMRAPLGLNPLATEGDAELDRSTSVVGVHGRNRFPTTFLIVQGKLVAWEKEVKTAEGLSALAESFLSTLRETPVAPIPSEQIEEGK